MIKVSHRCGTFFVYDAATAIKRLAHADAGHNKKTSTDVEVSRIFQL